VLHFYLHLTDREPATVAAHLPVEPALAPA
jgi:hypothetical protein